MQLTRPDDLLKHKGEQGGVCDDLSLWLQEQLARCTAGAEAVDAASPGQLWAQ